MKRVTLTIVNTCSIDRDSDNFEEIVALGYDEDIARIKAAGALFHAYCTGDKPCHLQSGKMVEYYMAEGIQVEENFDEDELADAMGWDYTITMEFENKQYALPDNFHEYYIGGHIISDDARRYDTWLDVAEKCGR